jgi:orotate phosphoribosyltransferase
MNDRRTLIQLLRERSVQRGRFTLASGRTSPYYIDARLTTMSPDGMAVIGPLALDELRTHGWRADAVGGLTLAADPIAYAMAYASNAHPPSVRAFTVRKEGKQHGTGRLVEGPLLPGDHVVIVEDVITTGASARQAAAAAQAAGGLVRGILALVDREEGGKGELEAAGYELLCLTTVADLLA